MRLLEILAQTPLPPTTLPGTGAPPPSGLLDFLRQPSFALIVGVLVLFIFMSRAKKNEERDRKEQLSKVKKGDRIQTIGGMLGTVVDVRDNEVIVKADESTNTKIRFVRSAIHKILGDEKPEVK